MNTYEVIGGIELKHVVAFQTQIMMGRQFGRIKQAQTTADIIVACLRLGWNDSFRHTSENTKRNDGQEVLAIKSAEWSKEHKADYDDYICQILSSEIVLDVFHRYATAKTTEEKVKAVESRFDELKPILGEVKDTTGKRRLCFGHFQKMFNIAIKLYLCLYMCRGFLDIDEGRFDIEIIHALEKADCPIDSVILGKLAEDTSCKTYSKYKWSKFGTASHPIDEYTAVQEEISKLPQTDGKSNLYYDFIAWEK